ncbi:hypothetical protein [Zhongshania borealis]|uniref:Uncharacterized protein n=1 Tax=Zhongshania borealis TaxID=889488 RepID=A0ABP7WRS6_9GAMM
MKSLKTILPMAAAISLAVSANTAYSANIVAPLTEFVSNTAAKADEVNGNFNALVAAVNDVAGSVASLVDRVAALENGATVEDLSDSVAGRCYKVTSINVELDYGSGMKNGYILFDESGNGAMLSYLRNAAKPDLGQETDATTEFSDYDITWTQDLSTVTTTRAKGEGEDEIIHFTATPARDVLVATHIDPSGTHGETELYILSEMDCEEAEAGEEVLGN